MATEKLTLTFSARDEGAKALLTEVVDRVERLTESEGAAAAGAGELSTAARAAAEGLDQLSEGLSEGLGTEELRTARELLERLGIEARIVGDHGADGIRRLVVAERDLAQANDLLAKANLDARATTAGLAAEAQRAAAASREAGAAQERLRDERGRFVRTTEQAAQAEEQAARATEDQGQAARQAAETTERHERAVTRQARAMGTAETQAKRLTTALRRVVGLIAAYQVGQFVKDQVDTADAIDNLSQRTGVAAETLSVFAHAAKLSDTNLDELQNGFRGLARFQQEVADGNADAAATLAAIGIEADKFVGLSLDEALLLVANELDRFEDGAEKAVVAGELFGERVGIQLLPLLRTLAGEGFARTREEAERLGVVFDEEAAEAAADFNDSLDLLKTQAGGLAFQLAQGVVPALTDIIAVSQEAETTTGSLASTIGEGLGGALRQGAAVAFAIFEGIRQGARQTITFVQGIAEAADRLRQGDLQGAREKLRETLDNAQSYADGFTNAYRDFLARLDAAEQRRNQAREQRQETERERERRRLVLANQEAAREAAAARLEAEEQARQAELRRLAALDEQREAEAEAAYERGLLALDAFFAGRAQRIRNATAREIEAMEATAREIASTPVASEAERIRRDAAAEQVRAQIRERTLEQEAQLQALEAERARELERLTGALESFARREQTARGETLTVALAAIEEETRAYAEALRQRGQLSEADQTARVARFRELLTDRAVVDDLRRQAAAVENALATERLRIQTQVTEGLLSEREAQEAIARLELGRVGTLRELAQQMTTIAERTGDPVLIQAARQFTAELEAMEASAARVVDRMGQFRDSALDAAQGELATFLGSTITQVDSLGEAFGELAVSVISNLQRIAAEIVASEAFEALHGLLVGGEASTGSGVVAAATALTTAGASVATGGGAVAASAPALSTAGGAVAAGGTAVSTGAAALTSAAASVTAAAGAITAAAAALAAAAAAAAGANGLAAARDLGFNLGASLLPNGLALARGGYVSGPGTSTSDSIAARLSAGEYVIRAAAVQRYGRELFDLLNGMQLTRVRRPGLPSYATGGLVVPEAGAGAATLGGRVEFGLADGLVAREVRLWLRSREGQETVIAAALSRPKTMRAGLGVG